MSNAEGSAIDQNLNEATGQGGVEEENAPQPEPREDEE